MFLMRALPLFLLPIQCSVWAEDFDFRQTIVDDGFMSSQPSGQEYFWLDYLSLGGSVIDCQFTIELLRLPDDRSPAARACVRDDREIASIEAMIAKVSEAVPGVAFVRGRRNKDIVHVIDDRLKQLPDYVLERHVDVSYSGVVGDLDWLLHKQWPAIDPSAGGAIGDIFDDHVTRVEVNAKGEKLRDVLTDCLPLRLYGPLLWRAITEKAADGARTHLQYYGVNPHKAVSWRDYLAEKAAELDFSFTIERAWPTSPDGEPTQWPPLSVAYLARADTVDTIDALVEKFRREIASVKVFRNAEDPAVIHLVEQSLLTLPDYPLERRINIAYSGALTGLPAAIATKISDVRLAVREAKSAGANAAFVRIDVSNKTLRDMLTTAVPQPRSRHLLWESIIVEEDQGYQTSIQIE